MYSYTSLQPIEPNITTRISTRYHSLNLTHQTSILPPTRAAPPQLTARGKLGVGALLSGRPQPAAKQVSTARRALRRRFQHGGAPKQRMEGTAADPAQQEGAENHQWPSLPKAQCEAMVEKAQVIRHHLADSVS